MDQIEAASAFLNQDNIAVISMRMNPDGLYPSTYPKWMAMVHNT